MQVVQGFSSFFTKFDDFSKWGMSNFEKLSNMYTKNLAKNEENPCSTCLKTNFTIPFPKLENISDN